MITINITLTTQSESNTDPKKVKKFDGWWWRYQPKGFQKTNSIRVGTIFFENKIEFW
jgi:hypothetical protein